MFIFLAFQIGSRLLTTALNIVIVRKIKPEEFGVGTLQLHLLLSFILLLSREAFRKAFARCSFKVIEKQEEHQEGEEKKEKTFIVKPNQVISMSLLSMMFGIMISFIGYFSFIYTASVEELKLGKKFNVLLLLTCIAGVIELLGEGMLFGLSDFNQVQILMIVNVLF